MREGIPGMTLPNTECQVHPVIVPHGSKENVKDGPEAIHASSDQVIRTALEHGPRCWGLLPETWGLEIEATDVHEELRMA